jgi:hypothetical protein
VKKRALAAGLLALILAAPTAEAKAPIAITNLAPTLSINFTGGDQVSAMAQGAGAIYLTGTVESATPLLLTSQTLGGSDGFLVALSTNSSRVWDLRLGTSGDDVATSIYVDLIGNIWVAGASAVSASTPAPGLNRLTVWEVNSAGQLINTYVRDVPEADVPTSIVAKGANFLLQGITSKAGSATFAATLNPAAKIGSLNYSSAKLPAASIIKSTSSALYGWQSYVTSVAIKGVIGIALHQKTTVLAKYGIKDKALKTINSVTGSPMALQYQSGTGVVLLTQGKGYFLTIVHTK